MKVNTINLTNELIMSGITTHGNCNSTGVVWDDNNNEIQDRKDVKAVLAKHDPTPIIEETLDEKIKRIVSEELRK